ncbi:MAG: solute:Na+ symporter, family [Solirubrobacteraceae bacterium]
MLRLHPTALDYAILAVYFMVVLGIGVVARLSVKTDVDFFLSGRRLPAWITGVAFIAANLGALEVLGQAANGAQYGVAAVHYYWIGAVPAMIFLGLVMMPFYYGSKVRSVPEYLRRRFNKPSHLFNAVAFSLATILIAGVNLYALALVLKLMLGWPIILGIVVAAAIVLVYITLGGLSSAIYNEVLQFFVIVIAVVPVTYIGLKSLGGWHGLTEAISKGKLGEGATHSWQGLSVSNATNPIGANWIAIVFGLGFVQSFGYWTTNFAEVQRAMSASSLSAARRTPLIGAFPKLLAPAITIIPGMIAVASIKGLGGSNADLQYNNAIPLLMGQYFPNGMLGLAVAGLLAAVMAGVAANVSAFNTVVTYDLLEPYIRPGRPDEQYVRYGRIATVAGIVVSIATALIASGYSNIMNYIQVLFSVFNVPLFATFFIGMFWKRMTPWAGFWGMVAGSVGALGTYVLYKGGVLGFGSDLAEAFWGAIIAFCLDAAVSVGVTFVTEPKPVEELQGLVYGMANEEERPSRADRGWYRSPRLLGFAVLGLTLAASLFFI